MCIAFGFRRILNGFSNDSGPNRVRATTRVRISFGFGRKNGSL